MKKLFTVLFLMITLNAYSQFEVSTSLAQGISIKDNFDITEYQNAITVTGGYTFDRFTLNLISSSVISDSATSYYTGIMPSVNIWQKDNKQVNVSGIFQVGMEGNKLAGLGLGYANDKVTFGINAMRELKLNETWIEAVIGFSIYSED